MASNDDIISVIQERRSVRTYEPRPLKGEDRATVQALMAQVSNPFGEEVHLHLLENVDDLETGVGKCGTVRDAKSFLGVSAALTPMAPLAMGYQFESLLLGAAACGLGTVWITTAFKRQKFVQAMRVARNEWLAAVSPVGYAAPKCGSAEVVMRKMFHADERELWRDIFTEDGFQIQLSEEHAGAYIKPLEMLRWAPSARNAQPWRVVKKENVFYFYETHKASLSDSEKQFKQMEIGAALAHFHLTAQSMGLHGHFDNQPLKDVHIPENTFYHISWVMD